MCGLCTFLPTSDLARSREPRGLPTHSLYASTIYKIRHILSCLQIIDKTPQYKRLKVPEYKLKICDHIIQTLLFIVQL